jgi:hypothetical protein
MNQRKRAIAGKSSRRERTQTLAAGPSPVRAADHSMDGLVVDGLADEGTGHAVTAAAAAAELRADDRDDLDARFAEQ